MVIDVGCSLGRGKHGKSGVPKATGRCNAIRLECCNSLESLQRDPKALLLSAAAIGLLLGDEHSF